MENELDVTFAMIDVLMFGKLEIERLGGSSGDTYYATVSNYVGDIMFDATERRVGDVIVSLRDQVVANFKKYGPRGGA